MNKEEAINILKQRQCCMECVADCKCEDCDKAFEMAIESLENQKTGHWIKHENSKLGKCMQISYECSNCKVWLGCEYFVRKSYCPNCGARMKGVK